MWALVACVVFAVATGFAWDGWSLIAFRFLLGLAVGADYPNAASFSAGYLPQRVRGRWLVAGFSFQALGMLAGMGLAKHQGWGFIQEDMESAAGTALLDLLLVVGFAIAIWQVDRVGRLPLQKAGFFGAAVGLGLLGVAAMSGNPMRLVILGFAVFNLMINAGPDSTAFLVPAEIYPTRLRATGHGFAASSGKNGGALGVFVLPILQSSWGTAAMAGVGLLGLAVTLTFGEETRNVQIIGVAHDAAVATTAGVTDLA
jgi:hypothetical protein